MARPKKSRKVCKLPKSNSFSPVSNDGVENNSEDYVVMTVDEYETIRLIDYIQYNQEDCAKQMEIARTTVQLIYNGARKKLADALVNGKMLIIDGGEIALCEEDNPNCCMKTNVKCCCKK